MDISQDQVDETPPPPPTNDKTPIDQAQGKPKGMVDPNNKEEIPKCICCYCGSEFFYDSKKHGTSHLLNHFRNVCEFSRYKVDEKKQKALSFKPIKGGKEGETNLVLVAYNKEACRLSLSKYIVLDELPFRHVQGEGF
ncbi:uncharacterized protein LOC133799678 [Humulus lupulus]|uniref:uncharacterized protein LOC133799678 n=1 Tax=Humulus lupulus TaxID=3486 RepID=UPI002B40F807|nr:uncharacterized protein LOC133799678 [Humulus lupulus]